MTIELAVVGKGPAPRTPTGDLVLEYLERAGRYQTTRLREFASEAALLGTLSEKPGRPGVLFATDSRGEQVSSEQLAKALGEVIDGGAPRVLVGVGPADGWSAEALAKARLVVAFGRITLPHELAAAVAAEQIYRALTIRAGHPYHLGHAGRG